MKRIALGKSGLFVLVDDGDFEFASQESWLPHGGRSTHYASRLRYLNGKPKRVYLHRELCGVTDPKVQVDHRDGDGLNCQRLNLRVATNAQNHRAKITRPATFKSRYRGVYWHKQNRNWCAQIKQNYQKIHIGSYEHESEAAFAYDLAALILFGAFAQFNDPYKIHE